MNMRSLQLCSGRSNRGGKTRESGDVFQACAVVRIFSIEAMLLNHTLPRVFSAELCRRKVNGVRHWPLLVSNHTTTSSGVSCQLHFPLQCAHTRSPQSMMQGAAPDSLHKTPLLEILPTQHSSPPPGRPLQPVPPHVPHSAEQQVSPD